MRALLLIVALSLCEYSWSSDLKQLVPPVSGQAEGGNKKDKPTPPKEEITVNFPSSMNMNVGGKLDIVSKSEQKRTYEEPNRWTDPITWLTLIIAFANIMLWIKTGGLVTEATTASRIAKIAADASRKAAEAAGDSVKAYQASERAWVAVSDIEYGVTSEMINGKAVEGYWYRIMWINSGKTPAINTDLFSEGNVFEPNDVIPHFKRIGEEVQVQAPMAPGIIIRSNPCFFSNEIIEELRAGKRRVFIYGTSRYTDIFSKDIIRETEVCVDVNYSGIDLETKRIHFNFSAYGKQNRAT
jgi:hypothetical protein